MFRQVLSLEVKEDCVLESSVPGVGKGTYDIARLKARRARDERIDLYDGSTLTGRLHVRLAWRFDPGLDYAPFTPEPMRQKAEVANQLKIALVQAAGLTEGSPLVVFEVSSSDKILHRWRSQERKKTPHPVWYWPVWKSTFVSPRAIEPTRPRGPRRVDSEFHTGTSSGPSRSTRTSRLLY